MLLLPRLRPLLHVPLLFCTFARLNTCTLAHLHSRTLSPFHLLTLSLILFTTTAHAQQYTSTNKTAIKRYEAGSECMRMRKWECARSEFTKAAAADERFAEPRLMLAEMHEMRGEDAEAITRYREVLAISPRLFPTAQLHLAELEFRSGQYDAARRNYQVFLQKELDVQRQAKAKLGLANCDFAERAIQQPVPFEPINLGPGVNTAQPEYYPAITADDQKLLFTRRLKAQDQRVGEQEDFYVSTRGRDGQWQESRTIPSVNTDRNEGAGTLSPDGRFIIFTACELYGEYGPGRKGLGSCDLFISVRTGERWSQPENLGPPVNSRNWESQPSLASDGRTLYFVRGISARDGVRNTDIYVTVLGDDGQWSNPEKLGPNINTPFNEESVQIHPDGRTLYFSSNGHPGMGGLDIYVSRKEPDGTWGPALNLGYPINTGDDENSLLVSASGEIAYFASDRPGGFGDLDLYSFELYPEARPHAVSYIRGVVTDKITGKPVEADIELFDVTTGDLATAAYSDPQTGEFLVALPVGQEYALNASSEGYLFFSENYDVPVTAVREPYTLNVPLSPLTAGSTIALRNIFFNTASYELLPASNAELDKLTRLLKANPQLRIELGGHTDNVGTPASNATLSDQRANAVRDHLVAQGIDASRITAKGYGETKPVASNETEEGRAENRRTEVTVL
jgi:outer membrane protein OmpA-like peptidoglycan-associated protein/Tol biopolymer transport system component